MIPLYSLPAEHREVYISRAIEGDYGGKIYDKLEGGNGEVYFLSRAGFRGNIALKCPRFVKFGSPEKALRGLEGLMDELEKSHQMYQCPFISRVSDVKIYHGWPFLVSATRDGTLRDLIQSPARWCYYDKLSVAIMISRALLWAKEKLVEAQLDLKPENVFFEEVEVLLRDGTHLRQATSDDIGLRFHIFVGDFGSAKFVGDFGKQTGSKPYKAPEQYDEGPILDASKVDVFSLAVMTYEIISDGWHPIGEKTIEIFPWRREIPHKWNKDRVWKEWAFREKKELQHAKGLELEFVSALQKVLHPDQDSRMELGEFEENFWRELVRENSGRAAALKKQIACMESLPSPRV
jgi:serine/threonine protein kinase